MTNEPPIARLKPGGRAETPPARTHMVSNHIAGTDSDDEEVELVRPPLREWHDMTPTQRKAAWAELVDWVIWLHDRYELAVEHRIPHCWAQHPGLIEELYALKVWREQIYTSPEPSGQAARYWHAELRQLVHAASTFYARGCRAGHKSPQHLAAADQPLQARWLAGDPLAGVPPQLLTANADIAGDPTLLSDPQMRAAINAGHTRPVGRTISDYQHYRGVWWTLTADGIGWQQITDPVFATELDAAARRIHAADALLDDHERHREPVDPDGDQP